MSGIFGSIISGLTALVLPSSTFHTMSSTVVNNTASSSVSSGSSMPKPSLQFIDLTSDEVTPPSSGAKSSRELWRERHKKKALPVASTSAGTSSSHPITRSQSSLSASVEDLNASLEVVEVEAFGGRLKRRGGQSSDEASTPRKRKAPVAVARKEKTPPPEVVYRCPVCLDSNKELKARNEGLMCLTVCGHVLCKTCSVPIALLKECPVCRKKFGKGKAGMHPLFL